MLDRIEHYIFDKLSYTTEFSLWNFTTKLFAFAKRLYDKNNKNDWTNGKT